MNVGTLLPFPPSPMYYTYSLPGVEWTQHTIGGDDKRVGAQRYDARLNGVLIHAKMDESFLRTIGNLFSASSSHPTDFYSV
jgi:hypothetical protein